MAALYRFGAKFRHSIFHQQIRTFVWPRGEELRCQPVSDVSQDETLKKNLIIQRPPRLDGQSVTCCINNTCDTASSIF
jgi:hypothetical protein